MINFIKNLIFRESKKLITFARVEPTQPSIRQGVNIFGSDINKKIYFYITDGKKLAKVNETSYTEAKEKFYKKRFIFIPEKLKEDLPIVRQDIGKMILTRVIS